MPHSLKRKRAVDEKVLFAAAKARRDNKRQFCRGQKTDIEGMGCGWCDLSGPWVASQYPAPKEMHLEVMAGTGDAEDGSIRICGSRDYRDLDAVWLMPFQLMDQVFVLPNMEGRIDGTDHQIIIVPTPATGFSPLKRRYPQIISFNWPDRPVEEEYDYKKRPTGNKRAAVRDDDTWLSLFKRVFDQLLEPFGKQVQDLTESFTGRNGVLHCSAALSYSKDFPRRDSSPDPAVATGQVIFHKTGFLFLSKSTRLFLPFHSLQSKVVLEESSTDGACRMVMEVNEPFFEDPREDEENITGDDTLSGGSVVLIFDRIPLDMRPDMAGFLEAYKINA